MTGREIEREIARKLTAALPDVPVYIHLSEEPCGARAVFWPDDEACDAECVLAAGHQPEGVHEDEILGEWNEDDLFTTHPDRRPA